MVFPYCTPHHPLSLPLCQRGLVRPALPLQTHLNRAKIKVDEEPDPHYLTESTLLIKYLVDMH